VPLDKGSSRIRQRLPAKRCAQVRRPRRDFGSPSTIFYSIHGHGRHALKNLDSWGRRHASVGMNLKIWVLRGSSLRPNIVRRGSSAFLCVKKPSMLDRKRRGRRGRQRSRDAEPRFGGLPTSSNRPSAVRIAKFIDAGSPYLPKTQLLDGT